MEFDHKYRVRKGFLGKCILQKLVSVPVGEAEMGDEILKWVDVKYDNAPRALTTEIKQ